MKEVTAYRCDHCGKVYIQKHQCTHIAYNVELKIVKGELYDVHYTPNEETYNKLVRQASSGLFDVRYVLFFILKHYFIAPKDKVRAEYEFNDQAGLATAIRTGEMANNIS